MQIGKQAILTDTVSICANWETRNTHRNYLHVLCLQAENQNDCVVTSCFPSLHTPEIAINIIKDIQRWWQMGVSKMGVQGCAPMWSRCTISMERVKLLGHSVWESSSTQAIKKWFQILSLPLCAIVEDWNDGDGDQRSVGGGGRSLGSMLEARARRWVFSSSTSSIRKKRISEC